MPMFTVKRVDAGVSSAPAAVNQPRVLIDSLYSPGSFPALSNTFCTPGSFVLNCHFLPAEVSGRAPSVCTAIGSTSLSSRRNEIGSPSYANGSVKVSFADSCPSSPFVFRATLALGSMSCVAQPPLHAHSRVLARSSTAATRRAIRRDCALQSGRFAHRRCLRRRIFRFRFFFLDVRFLLIFRTEAGFLPVA